MRRSSIAASIAIVLIIAMAITAKLWFIPIAVRKGVISEIRKSWPGRVHIEKLKFYFRGRITIGQLLLQDNRGRNRLRLKNARAFLTDISRLNFKVKNLEIASADIDLFPPPESFSTKSGNFFENFTWLNRGHFDIKQLSIESITVILHNIREEKATYGNLQLSINKLSHLQDLRC